MKELQEQSNWVLCLQVPSTVHRYCCVIDKHIRAALNFEGLILGGGE
jgi:hypothetical protein